MTVLQTRMPTKLSRPQRENATLRWVKARDEVFIACNPCHVPKVITLTRLRVAELVARMKQKRHTVF